MVSPGQPLPNDEKRSSTLKNYDAIIDAARGRSVDLVRCITGFRRHRQECSSLAAMLFQVAPFVSSEMLHVEILLLDPNAKTSNGPLELKPDHYSVDAIQIYTVGLACEKIRRSAQDG